VAAELKELKMVVRDSLSLAPVAGLRIEACAKPDLTCSKPTVEGESDRDGILTLKLPADFSGYLQHADRSDYAPSMYLLPTPLPANGVLKPFPLLSAGAVIDALAVGLGGKIDPARGHLMLIAEDCFGTLLTGITFSSPQTDKSTIQFYVQDLLPTTTVHETTEAGDGGYLNFPTGAAEITLKQAKTGLELTTVNVAVRAGFISVAYIQPSAR
jgi:hypothetical protein